MTRAERRARRVTSPAIAQAATLNAVACTHCPGCTRSPEFPVGTERAYCAPCIVALYDHWTELAGQGHDVQKHLLAISEHIDALQSRTWSDSRDGRAPHFLQLRAMHIYGWRAIDDVTLGDPASADQVQVYSSYRAFANERIGGWSEEADFGGYNSYELALVGPASRWRVSVVATTGDVYATPLSLTDPAKRAPVVLIGSVLPSLDYDDADARFSDWADAPRDVAWFIDRVAEPHVAVSAPALLPPDARWVATP